MVPGDADAASPSPPLTIPNVDVGSGKGEEKGAKKKEEKEEDATKKDGQEGSGGGGKSFYTTYEYIVCS